MFYPLNIMKIESSKESKECSSLMVDANICPRGRKLKSNYKVRRRSMVGKSTGVNDSVLFVLLSIHMSLVNKKNQFFLFLNELGLQLGVRDC